MIEAARGQDLSRICWEPMDADSWLTACVPLDLRHEIENPVEWPQFEYEATLPADEDIVAGRVSTFESMDDLLADLESPD